MRTLTRLILLFSLLLGSGLLGGCQPLAALAASRVKPISLETCIVVNGQVKAECGTLRVPEDRSHPGGRTLDLKVVVVRASGPDRQPDPLFYIVGGPGVAVTTDSIVTTSYNYIFSKVNEQRDLVFVDQRGTNDSHRLACAWPAFEIADGTQQQVNDWIKQCLAKLDGDPRFYTTVPAMQDLDAARAALGYDKINLYGISYGAKAVQVYARMYPEHTRAVVIDHGNALDLPLWPTILRATQSALDQVLSYCEQDEPCHAAYRDIRGDMQAVLARLSKGTVVTGYTPPGATEPAKLSKADLESGIYSLLYNGEYGQIPFLIHTLAANEDWTQFAKSYSEQHPSIAASPEPLLVMLHMIDCFDPAEQFGQGVADRLDPGAVYTDTFMNSTRYWQRVCPALPKPDPSLIYGTGKPAAFSMLALNSLLDPIFPPSSMDLALKEFTKSRVVVEPTEGHEPKYPPECRWSIIARYIQKGSMDGLDTSCLQEIKPSFVVVSQ